MKSFRHRLPPLHSLMVFEAAAREQNFSRAARELHVTQAAVSQQVHALEDYLETALFRRAGRGVELTRQGVVLQQQVNAALSYLADAVDAASSATDVRGISVSANTAMAHLWLSPAINAFRQYHRDKAFRLRLMTSDHSGDLLADDIDIAVLYDCPPQPGWHHRPLFEECLFPVASPGYLDRHGRNLEHPRALLSHKLLDFERIEPNWVNWERWFDRLGIEAQDLVPEGVFNSYSLLIDAAEQGQGIALGTAHQIDDKLAAGTLERVGHASVKTGRHYSLALRQTSDTNPEALQLADWLLGRVGSREEASGFSSGKTP